MLTACLANNYRTGAGHIPWHYDEVCFDSGTLCKLEPLARGPVLAENCAKTKRTLDVCRRLPRRLRPSRNEVRAHGVPRCVASLSLGGPREFRLRRRRTSGEGGGGELVASLDLAPGSVLLMTGRTQVVTARGSRAAGARARLGRRRDGTLPRGDDATGRARMTFLSFRRLLSLSSPTRTASGAL